MPRAPRESRQRHYEPWRVELRAEYEAAVGCECQHCGERPAAELHHYLRKRGKEHAAPSMIWKASGPPSAVRKQWAQAFKATVALCKPCHALVEAFQGRTRVHRLPFQLSVAPGAPFQKRVGPCRCSACSGRR